MEESSKPKRVPRKQLFVNQIDQLLLLSEAQLKTWLYHYRREGGGEQRKSWAGLEAICHSTQLSESAITHARTWLVRNGWLEVVGLRPSVHLGGDALLREYRCCFPQSVGTGKPTVGKSVGIGKPTASAPESLRRRLSNAAEVKSPKEVTATPIPDEVILATNSLGKERKKEGKEEAPVAPLTTPVSPDAFKEFFFDEPKGEDVHIHKLMLMMQGYWTYKDWSSEYPMAMAIMDDARADNYNPYALLLHNRSHHPPNDKKHGGLYFRSFAQWLKAMQTSTRSLNDYDACRKEPCSICEKHRCNMWTKDHPMLGVDGILCGCTPNPHVIALDFMCTVCRMSNNGMNLEPVEPSNGNGKGLDTPPGSAPPPVAPCPHGNSAPASCWECTHPPNATCKWKECGKRFHAFKPEEKFCSLECRDKFGARQEELKAKYAKPEAENHLAAFLEGR